ncbi:MAG: DUF4331 family protein [Streptomyces sp.]|uniref:DUF4331 family protein n=1 Tax=Streptomyces sp. TaxID=1931 RepID=UPI003D6BC9F4
MSDHLDGLSLRNTPSLDISDFYVFPNADGTKTVFVLNVMRGPFSAETRYEINIDSDGDASPDIVLYTMFHPELEPGGQSFVVREVTGPQAPNRNANGHEIGKGWTNTVRAHHEGFRVFAGRAGDPFYIDGTVVTAVRTAIVNGSRLDLGDWSPEKASNAFRGNIHAIVVEVPNAFLQKPKNAGTIRAWGSIAVPLDAADGRWRQTDRAGTPLLSTMFGYNEGDEFNAARPQDDAATYGPEIHDMISRVVRVNHTHKKPEEHAERALGALLPDALRYTLGTPAAYGALNGRSLTDNAPEKIFHTILNAEVPMGLDSGDATGTVRSDFPYVSEPVA